jgi:hypothetical protein
VGMHEGIRAARGRCARHDIFDRIGNEQNTLHSEAPPNTEYTDPVPIGLAGSTRNPRIAKLPAPRLSLEDEGSAYRRTTSIWLFRQEFHWSGVSRYSAPRLVFTCESRSRYGGFSPQYPAAVST